MTIVKVKPFGSASLMNDFDHLFNEFFGKEFPAATSNGKTVTKSRPAINVLEKKDAFELALAAPGLTKSDFTLKVEKEVLTISVAKEVSPVEGEDIKRREFSFHAFERRFQLPDTVEATAIKATYDRGILTVTLPKRKEVLPRTIEIG